MRGGASVRSLSADYLKRSQRIFKPNKIDEDGLVEPTEEFHSVYSRPVRRGPPVSSDSSRVSNSRPNQSRPIKRYESSPSPRDTARARYSQENQMTESDQISSRNKLVMKTHSFDSNSQNRTSLDQALKFDGPTQRPSRPVAPNVNPVISTQNVENLQGHHQRNFQFQMLPSHQNRSNNMGSRTLHISNQSTADFSQSVSPVVVSPIDQNKDTSLSSLSSDSYSPSHFTQQRLSPNPRIESRPEPALKPRIPEATGRRLTVEQMLQTGRPVESVNQRRPQNTLARVEDLSHEDEVDIPSVTILTEKFYRALQLRADERFKQFKSRLNVINQRESGE
jgi:hypothetical protein